MAVFKKFMQFMYGFRKWIIALLVLGVCVGFLITGHISGREFADILSIVIPSYMGANVMEHGKELAMEYLKNKSEKDNNIEGE